MNKIISWERKVLLILFLLMAGMSLTTYINDTSVMKGGVVTAGIVMVILFMITQKAVTRLPKSALLALVFVMVVIPRLLLIINIDAQPWNDFSSTMSAAEKLASHDRSGVLGYATHFPDLIPWIVFEAIIVRLFPANPIIVIRILNCIVCGLIGVSIFIMGKKISLQMGLLAAGMYAFLPSSIVFAGVLSAQHFSAACQYMTFTLLVLNVENNYTKFRKITNMIIVGILLGFGQLFRPDAAPILLAVLLFLFLQYSSSYKLGQAFNKWIFSSILILTSFLIVSTGAFEVLQQKHIISNNRLSSDLGGKFYAGLKIINGRFDMKDAQDYLSANSEIRRNLITQQLSYYLEHPLAYIELQSYKFDVMWGQPSPSYYWLEGNEIEILQEKVDNKVATSLEMSKLRTLNSYRRLFSSLDEGYYLWVTMLAMVGVMSLGKNYSSSSLRLLTWFSFCYIGVFFFIEVQSRYRYLLEPTLIFFAAYGMINLINLKKLHRLIIAKYSSNLNESE